MIYLEGLDSIIESFYLHEELSNRIGSCDIFVNPGKVKYLVRKIVIINICEYPIENIQVLLNNNCHIISRVFIDNPGVEIRPYILRICPEIMWNGRIIKKPIKLNEVMEGGFCDLDVEEFKLYFPKLYDCSDRKPTDDYKNLTVLGWVLQQVGINICTKTPLTDLDLIKTQKIEFT